MDLDDLDKDVQFLVSRSRRNSTARRGALQQAMASVPPRSAEGSVGLEDVTDDCIRAIVQMLDWRSITSLAQTSRRLRR